MAYDMGRYAAEAVMGGVAGLTERAAFQRKQAEDRLARQRAEASMTAGVPRAEAEAARAVAGASGAQAGVTQQTAEMTTEQDIQAQLDAAREQNRALVTAQARKDSFESFRMYTADSDPKHLMNALKGNPLLAKASKNLVSIDKVDYLNDRELLVRSGYEPDDFDPANPDSIADPTGMAHRYLKFTNADGTKQIVDMQQMMLGTGYAQHATKQELEEMLLRNKVQKELEGDKPTLSALEKKAKYLAQAERGELPPEEAKAAKALGRAEVAGIAPGRQDVAFQQTQALDEAFEGRYFETDMTVPENRVRASRHIRALEDLGKVALTPADKTDIKDISMLIQAAGTAEEQLSPEVTGILDDLTHTIRKYTSNNMDTADNVMASSAHSAYRNALLRAFGGTAMSDSEVKNFDKAFGTLAQKYPAVITQFKLAVEQTRAKLGALSQLNDPYVAHYYVGRPLDDIDTIITRLDRTIGKIDDVSGTVAQDSNKAKLDAIFGAK